MNCLVAGRQNNSVFLSLILLILIINIYCSGVLRAGEGNWPKSLSIPAGELTLYQPQPESFDADSLTLQARAALSFQGKDQDTPVFGAILFTAKFLTDRDERQVTLEQLTITDWKFPNATDEQVGKLQNVLNKHFAGKVLSISLDELMQSLQGAGVAEQGNDALSNKPPEIIFREHPAALILLDGKPVLQKVDNTDFMRVVNTPYMMLFSPKDNMYYLNGQSSWFSAKAVESKWGVSSALPEGLQEAAEVEGLLEVDSVEEQGVTPEIIVSQVPAELISTSGKTEFSPVTGTNLLYITNTSSVVIFDITAQINYTLISGRWYKTKSLEKGDWVYVEPKDLPADFKKIPADLEELEAVQAAIPGTAAANSAVLDASIPQTAEVKLDTAAPEITYDGQPKFESTGRAGVDYAVNTPSSVIKAGNYYYLCEDAIWYSGETPDGPWKVCTSVPGEIYEIPPAAPVYNTTYVRVYGSTPEVVYVGYTPGYIGSYVYRGVVVFGTGYYYRPWHGRYYYPRPATFGFAVGYNSYSGNWGFGIGYRGSHSGGFFFGIGYNNRYHHNGWWGRGGYHDRSVNINNNINININGNRIDRTKINNRVVNRNIYRNGETRNKIADRQGDRMRPVNSAERKTGNRADKDKTRERLEDRSGRSAAREQVGKVQDRLQSADSDKTLKPRQREQAAERIGDRAESHGWKKSPKQNNVFSDKQGNVFRSQNNGNNWQQLQHNGKWRNNDRMEKSTRNRLNSAKSSRQAGVQRNRQVQQRQRPQGRQERGRRR